MVAGEINKMGFADMNGTGFMVLSKANEVTGSLFMTLLVITLMLVLIAMLFRIPLEFTVIIILPFLLSVTAYETSFLSVTGVILIYLGLILANNFWFGK